jgi:hypothetical protein
VWAVRELAFLLIGAKAKFNKLFAQLWFFFILPYGRFAADNLLPAPRRGRVLSWWGIVHLLLRLHRGQRFKRQLESSSCDHANLICKLF